VHTNFVLPFACKKVLENMNKNKQKTTKNCAYKNHAKGKIKSAIGTKCQPHTVRPHHKLQSL
jgi:hypothetical protein